MCDEKQLGHLDIFIQNSSQGYIIIYCTLCEIQSTFILLSICTCLLLIINFLFWYILLFYPLQIYTFEANDVWIVCFALKCASFDLYLITCSIYFRDCQISMNIYIIIWYNINFCYSFNKARKKYLSRILFSLLKGGNAVDKKKMS